MDGNGKPSPQQPQQQQEGASPSPLAFYQYILRQGASIIKKKRPLQSIDPIHAVVFKL